MQNHYRALDTQQPVVVNQAVPTTVTIPAFSYNNGEDAFPVLLATAALGNTTPTTISLPLPEELTENETFGLTIRFTLNGNTIRYVLHKPHTLDGLLYADYEGQAIHPIAVFEIWANPTETLIESLTAIELQLGDYTSRGTMISTYGGTISGSSTTLILTNI